MGGECANTSWFGYLAEMIDWCVGVDCAQLETCCVTFLSREMQRIWTSHLQSTPLSHVITHVPKSKDQSHPSTVAAMS